VLVDVVMLVGLVLRTALLALSVLMLVSLVAQGEEVLLDVK
jgi:hypothetical protein